MKNLNKANLKTCIFLRKDEFKRICKDLEIQIEIEFDALYFNSPSESEALSQLAKYFDVERISSIHTDSEEFDLGVWLVYRN